jgi:thiazole/oxazole-forming peptide maturase SagD family component
LGNRELERDFLRTLDAAGDVDALASCYPRRSVDEAVEALRHHGIIERVNQTLVLDLHRQPDTPASSLLGAEPWSFETVSVSAPLGAPALGALLSTLRERKVPVLAAWTSGTSVVLGADDGRAAPCLRCALTFDAELREVAPGVLEGRPIEFETRASAAQLANALLATLSRPGAVRPAPGRARVVDASDLTARWEEYPRHPGCSCGLELPDTPTPVYESWEVAEARRFSPLICLERSAGVRPARVLFRRTLALRQCSSGDYGIASAAGENADVRAYAEGIERYCMLHCPPEVVDVPARELSTAFDEGAIRGSLFSPEAYARAGFRHRPFDSGLALDWSWASHVTAGERSARRLLPTSMIGAPRAGSPRLVDASTSGYAAHTHRDTAIALAALEVIERDAVLLWWHGRGNLLCIDGERLPPAWRATVTGYLVTQDVDLPIVMLTARLPSGGCRLTSAAATTFDEAWSKAVAEMEAALWTLERHGARSLAEPLETAAARHGPSEHLAFFLRSENAERIFARLAGAPEVPARQLQARWPGGCEALPAIGGALSAAGLDAWVVDRSLPRLFGPQWTVARVFIPDSLEVAWGAAYPRLNSPRFARTLAGRAAELFPHPIA